MKIPALIVLASMTSMVAAEVPPASSGGDLEARIKQLEDSAESLRQQAAEALAAAQAARAELQRLREEQRTAASDSSSAAAKAPSPAGGGSNAFNPAISLVLNGSYAHHSLHEDDYARAGFPWVGETGPGEGGFSLGESELTLSANVDDKFYGQISLAVESEDGEDHVVVEEAYLDTVGLGNGLSLRMGRFFSNLGYLNARHAHTDLFSDRPLAYQAFLGGQFGDDGLQLRWVAPADVFIEVGAEVFRGQNFPAGGSDQDFGAYSLFAHAGGDVGFEHAWLAGLSLLQGNDVQSEDGFVGDSRLLLADVTWKWAPQGNFRESGLTLRSEWFFEQRDGGAPSLDDPEDFLPWLDDRRGVYVEGAWQLGPHWRTGYRYDRLWSADTGPFAADFDPYRHGLMLTWLNSEFSLLRLQYSQERPGHSLTDHVLSLQYQASLGAHSAHKF